MKEQAKTDIRLIARGLPETTQGIYAFAVEMDEGVPAQPFLYILRTAKDVKAFAEMTLDGRYLHIDGKPVVALAGAELPGDFPEAVVWSFDDRRAGCCAQFRKLTGANYEEQVQQAKAYEPESSLPVYCAVSAGGKGYTPQLFYKWLQLAVNFTRQNFPETERYVLVEADKWDDAAEQALWAAIGYRNYDENEPLLLGGAFDKTPGWDAELDQTTQIAVQIHLFYIDLIDELICRLVSIQHPYDLYITTDSAYKAEHIRRKFAEARCLQPWLKKLQVEVCGNQGRDVVPFLDQLRPVYQNYKYFCHLHTKKSKHSNEGNLWRQFLYRSLLGSQSVTDDILYLLQSDPAVGIACPRPFEEIGVFMDWGANKENVYRVAQMIGIQVDESREKPFFPTGDMFWAKTEAVHQMLGYAFALEDIPPEAGQLDGTIMHAVERIWCHVATYNGYRTVLIENARQPGSGEGDLSAQAELSRIKSKKLWRLAEKIYKVADKLLPYGTRRRAFVKKLLSPFKK